MLSQLFSLLDLSGVYATAAAIADSKPHCSFLPQGSVMLFSVICHRPGQGQKVCIYVIKLLNCFLLTVKLFWKRPSFTFSVTFVCVNSEDQKTLFAASSCTKTTTSFRFLKATKTCISIFLSHPKIKHGVRSNMITSFVVVEASISLDGPPPLQSRGLFFFFFFSVVKVFFNCFSVLCKIWKIAWIGAFQNYFPYVENQCFLLTFLLYFNFIISGYKVVHNSVFFP